MPQQGRRLTKDKLRSLRIDCPFCKTTNSERQRYQLLDQHRIFSAFECEGCGWEYQAIFDMKRIQITDDPLIAKKEEDV